MIRLHVATLTLTVLMCGCTVQQARGPSSAPPPGPGAGPTQPGAVTQPGPMGWVEYRAEKYGFSMMVPPNTQIADREPWEDWGQVWAQNGPATMHGFAKLGVQAPPQAIEDAGIRYTGIPRHQWNGINQGQHSGNHWYRTAYASNGRDAVLAYYGTGPRGSYLLLFKTTVADYEANKPAYHRWYHSVRVW